MKQILQNILVVCLAVLVFFTGAGVTVVNLCCPDCFNNLISINNVNRECRHAPVTYEEQHSCCSSAEHSVEQENIFCFEKSDNGCCEIERISIDIENRVYKPVQDNISSLYSAFLLFASYIQTTVVTESISEYNCYKDVIPILPRDYLSLIGVLII